MSIPLYQALTTQFYEWEKRGRGWYVYGDSVDLEPPFVPFFFHYTPPRQTTFDDGKRPTLLSKLADLFKETPKQSQEEVVEEFQIEPFVFQNSEELRAVSISLPKGRKIKTDETEQLLLMLSSSTAPISFEIIASHVSIRIQFVCRESDYSTLQSQVKAYFPESILHDKTDLLGDIIKDQYITCLTDFGLQVEFMRPISMAQGFDLDPLTGLFGILENLNEGEQGAIQILFKGAHNPWAESIMRSVMDNDGKAFFLDAPEMLSLAKDKISSPLFGVTIRTIGQAQTENRAIDIASDIGNALIRSSRSQGNSLIHLSYEGYDFDTRMDDVYLRESHRLGMLLNTSELATFVHLPSISVQSSKLERDTKKTKAAPDSITLGHDFVLGTNFHQGWQRMVTLTSSQRLKHTHVIGATGTGKSTFLLNCIVQDINLGNGIAVLDPHGDLIQSILQWIPENRINDVIVIDPADAQFPVGFNILSAHSEIEKDILSSDLVAVFRRLSTSWGDQMNSVFANAILAFLESEQGGTLVDLRRFLVEKSFRDNYLKTVSDPNIVYYWQKEFPLLKSSSIGPILTRLDTFLRPKLIRNMVSQKKGLNFEEILDGKILLVKLSQGLIGTENSYILGTLFVSKIYQAAMARQAISKEARNDFFLYIDEFQNFITPSMAGILSGARKYHVGLILAHQDMQQLTKYDSELASSVISNAGTRICFRVGDIDAKKFESGFSFFEARDLQDLGIGEAIVRIDRPEYDFNLTTSPLPERDYAIAEKTKDSVIAQSREKYATPSHEVQAFIGAMLRGMEDAKVEKETVKPIQEEQPKKEELKPIQPIERPQSDIAKSAEKKAISQHRYLQTLIKRMAESRGYRASIEEPTPDGKGRVDVSLERNGKKIACEISMTTTEDWEVHNIEKCLAAGYETIVICSTERKSLEKIKNRLKEKLDAVQLSKILVFEPNELFIYLDQQVAKEASTEERVKGYRVKVEYDAISQENAKQKQESILKAVADTVRKKSDI